MYLTPSQSRVERAMSGERATDTFPRGGQGEPSASGERAMDTCPRPGSSTQSGPGLQPAADPSMPSTDLLRKDPTAFDLVVGMDTTALQAAIAQLLPAERDVLVSAAFDAVVLKGTVGRLAQNLRSLFQVGLLDVLVGRAPDLQLAPSLSAGRLPYGVAISAGTMGYLVARQLGFT